MKIMVVGDTHGMSGVVQAKAKIARALNIHHMMIVGDFGMWPGVGGISFLDDVNEAARGNNLKVYALPGNHEDHDQWNWWLNSGMPKDENKFTYVRSNLLISPKVHNWKWAEKRFFIAGGAVSIDKQWRTEGKSWWKDEEFSESDLASVEKYKGPDIDYLFTHDCSDHTQWGFNLVPDPESRENRLRIDRAIKALRPKMHFHGHMHRRYEWVNTASHGLRSTAFGYDESEWNGHSTLTYGLDCNGEDNSWGVLDTKQDKFFWPAPAVAEFDPAFA